MGKGNKLVPILITRDLEKCLDILVDESLRNKFGVANNEFVLDTQNSRWILLLDIMRQGTYTRK